MAPLTGPGNAAVRPIDPSSCLRGYPPILLYMPYTYRLWAGTNMMSALTVFTSRRSYIYLTDDRTYERLRMTTGVCVQTHYIESASNTRTHTHTAYLGGYVPRRKHCADVQP